MGGKMGAQFRTPVMYTLGLATMGSSAACLFRDGTLVAAVEEERLTRIKNDGAFPLQAVGECLRIGGITLADVTRVALYWQPWRLAPRALATAAKVVRRPALAGAMVARVGDFFLPRDPDTTRPEDTGSWLDLFRVRRKLTRAFGSFTATISFHDHHLSHQLYAEMMQDWPEFISLSYDGGGEAASTVVSVVKGGERTTYPPHLWPNSLGHFYSVFTGFLGFKMLEGEYKMMGLAPYGDPVWRDLILEKILRLRPKGRYRLDTTLCDYHGAIRGQFDPRLEAMFGPPRAPDAAPTQAHINLAASVQAAFEAAQAHVLDHVRAEHPELRRLVISGGCALNVTANGRLLQSGAFDAVIIPPAPHDAGCAIGAGLAALHGEAVAIDRRAVRSPYQGAGFTAAEILAAVAPGLKAPPVALKDAALVDQTAAMLEQGLIIGWFQGRAEFGPRALGTRSFLADPRRDEIREEINRKIKKRELFRPFAPSVTDEASAKFFEIAQPSPYMNLVARVRDDKAAVIPAVTHTDQTARVHSVSREANPLYHALLTAFGARTGVPVLLNTSFNIQEPIVYTPAQGFATFRASGVDALVIGPYIIRREDLA